MVEPVPEEGRQIYDPNNFDSQVREYVKLKATIATMETRSKELREKLFEKIDEDGYEDESGNHQLDLETSVDGVVRLEKQRRTSRKIDEDVANEIILANGLEEEVTKLVRVVDEDALMAAYYEGKLSEDELDKMFPVTVTWALRTLKK